MTMQSIKFPPWAFLLIVLACWLETIDATPLGSYTVEKARVPRQTNAWKSRRRLVHDNSDPIGKDSKSATVWSVKSPYAESSSYNFNRNVNVNDFFSGITRSEIGKFIGRQMGSMRTGGRYKNKSIVHRTNGSNDTVNKHSIPKVGRHELRNFKKTKMQEVLSKKCLINHGRIDYAEELMSRNYGSMSLIDAFGNSDTSDAAKTSSIHNERDMTLCWIETTTIKEDRSFQPPRRLVIKEFTISLENGASISEDDVECTETDGEISPNDEETVCQTSLREVIDVDTSQSRVVNFTKENYVGPINIRQRKTIKCAMGSVVYRDIYKWPDASDNPRKRVEIKISPKMHKVRSDVCASKKIVSESATEDNSSSESDCSSSESCETSETSEKYDTSNTAIICQGENCIVENSFEERPLTIYPFRTDKKPSATIAETTSTERSDTFLITGNWTTSSSHPKIDTPVDNSCKDNDECANEKSASSSCSDADCTGESSSESISDSCDDESEDASGTCSSENYSSEEVSSAHSSDETAIDENESRTDSLGSSCLFQSTEKSVNIPIENESTEATTIPHTDSTTKVPTFPSTVTTDRYNIEFIETSTEDATQESSAFGSTEVTTSNDLDASTTVFASCEDSQLENCVTDRPSEFGSWDLKNAKNPLFSMKEHGLYPVTPGNEFEITVSESQSNGDDVSTVAPTDMFQSNESPSRSTEEYATSGYPIDGRVTLMTTAATDYSFTPTTDVPTETFSSEYTIVGCIPKAEGGSDDCREKQTVVSPGELFTTTLSSRSCESPGSCDTHTELVPSTKIDQRLTIPFRTVTEKVDCDVSSESCDTSSSLESSSNEDDSSTELEDEAMITTTESAITEIVSNTASTVSSLMEQREGNHKIGLTLKVSLEHINDEKENEMLMEFEKHLLLNEGPTEHGNHSLVWKLKSLNNSVNMETFRSLFNCTCLENFTETYSRLTNFQRDDTGEISLNARMDDYSVEESANGAGESNESWSRKKREINVSNDNGTNERNITNGTQVTAIKKDPLRVDEDFHNGLGHVFHRLSREFSGPGLSEDAKVAESSSPTISKFLVNPADVKINTVRQKRESELRKVVSVEELKHPINGEEIDRWSKERFVEAADGGRVRSLLEFNIIRDSTYNFRRIPSGS